MATLAEQIAADAARAVSLADELFFASLDYSPASIDKLESLFDDVHYRLPGGKTAQAVDLLVNLWGSYLGEAMRQRCGGEWAMVEDRYGKAAALRLPHITVFPHGKVAKRFANGSADNVSDYYSVMTDIAEGRRSA